MRDVLCALGLVLAVVVLFGPPLVEGVQPAQVFDHAMVPPSVVPEGAVAMITYHDVFNRSWVAHPCTALRCEGDWCHFTTQVGNQQLSVPTVRVDVIQWADPEPLAESET